MPLRKDWINEYKEEHELKESDIVRKKSGETFKFGSGKTFVTEEYIEFPIKMKNDQDEEVVETIGVHIVDAKIPL